MSVNDSTAAKGTDNLIPPIMDCVKAYATVGEVVSILQSVFGEYRGRAS